MPRTPRPRRTDELTGVPAYRRGAEKGSKYGPLKKTVAIYLPKLRVIETSQTDLKTIIIMCLSVTKTQIVIFVSLWVFGGN